MCDGLGGGVLEAGKRGKNTQHVNGETRVKGSRPAGSFGSSGEDEKEKPQTLAQRNGGKPEGG